MPKGRVAAAAFSIVVFNVVLLAALVVVLILQVGASRLADDIMSASIVIAGVVQFVLVAGALRARQTILAGCVCGSAPRSDAFS